MADNPADADLLDQARSRSRMYTGPPIAPNAAFGRPVPSSRADTIAATVDSVTRWWEVTAASDARTTAPKAAEYGSSDLEIMGQAMQGLFPGIDALPPEERHRVGLEMAVAFYALGKCARLFGAYEQGRLPGEDSWYDLTVYSMMARRIREVGYWV